MKVATKLGLMLSVALMAAAALAVSAQAQVDINPDNTNITGTANDPTLDYEGTEVVCDSGTAIGTTGNNSDFVDVTLDFIEPCTVGGSLNATADCGTNRDTRLRALTADTNQGEADELLASQGFTCTVTVTGVCTITVGAQDLPITGGQNDADLINEGGASAINATVDVNATRSGSALCGPASGVGGFAGVYDLNPDVSFD
jgi:hypothetical protein